MDSHVIFRNFSSKRIWEMSGPWLTTYLSYDVIEYGDKEAIKILLWVHGIRNLSEVADMVIQYTNDPQEDMFLVEINARI
jgi:hypothetical protein